MLTWNAGGANVYVTCAIDARHTLFACVCCDSRQRDVILFHRIQITKRRDVCAHCAAFESTILDMKSCMQGSENATCYILMLSIKSRDQLIMFY